MSDPPPEYQADIARIAAVIAAARAHLGSGRSIDLTALETEVRALCDRIIDQPPADPEAAHEALEALTADLDDLEDELIARQEAHTEPVHEARHRRANRLYRRTDEES